MSDSKENSSKDPESKKTIEELEKGKEHSRNGYGDRDIPEKED